MSLETLLRDLRAVLPMAEYKMSGFSRDRDNTPQADFVAPNLDLLDEALDALPNGTDRADWIKLCAAMRGAYGVDLERGRAAFLKFSERWTGSRSTESDESFAEEADREWESFEGKTVGLGANFLFSKIEAAERLIGAKPRNFRGESFFEPIEDEGLEAEVAAFPQGAPAKGKTMDNVVRLVGGGVPVAAEAVVLPFPTQTEAVVEEFEKSVDRMNRRVEEAGTGTCYIKVPYHKLETRDFQEGDELFDEDGYSIIVKKWTPEGAEANRAAARAAKAAEAEATNAALLAFLAIHPKPETRADARFRARAERDLAKAAEAGLKPIPVTSFKDLKAEALKKAAPYLVKGFFDQDTLGVIYGPPNCGKTFIAMDLSYAIATGREWCGMKTTKLPVAYVGTEGGAGFAKRSAALAMKYGDGGDVEDLFVIRKQLNLFDKKEDLEELALTIRTTVPKCGLVILDTLAQLIGGGNESTSQDMGIFVANMNKLRTMVGGAGVIAIHHTGKDLSRGARGSNNLLGAIATEIEITGDKLETTKQRDLPKKFIVPYSLTTVEIGHVADADGEIDAVTSCYVTFDVEAGKAKAAKAKGGKDVVLNALMDMAHLKPTVPQILQYLAGQGVILKDSAVRTTLTRMLSKGTISQVPPNRWEPVKHNDE